MVRALFALMGLFATMLASAQSPKTEGVLQRSRSGVRPGQAAWVKTGDAPLVFTGQIVAADAGGDARTQAREALRALDATLKQGGSSLAQVARLSVYVAAEADVAAVEGVIGETWAENPVACTVVRTPLAKQGARVAFEGVGVSAQATGKVQITGHAALLPAGGKIFISGQAEKGADLEAGARATMAGLQRSLTHLGLTAADVVQVKAFIRPFEDHAGAVREIAASFGSGPVPPIVLIEWQSDLFTEIELVASARTLPAPAGGSLEYAWMPWLAKSPRYSSACRVAAGTPLIFLGALGAESGEPRAQVKATFERLGSMLFEAGAGFRSLVKASYYLGVPSARAVLGDIRDVYFDPARPPAASALNVASLGQPGRALVIDMIAVPLK